MFDLAAANDRAWSCISSFFAILVFLRTTDKTLLFLSHATAAVWLHVCPATACRAWAKRDTELERAASNGWSPIWISAIRTIPSLRT